MKERGIFNKYNAFWLATILVIFGLILDWFMLELLTKYI